MSEKELRFTEVNVPWLLPLDFSLASFLAGKGGTIRIFSRSNISGASCCLVRAAAAQEKELAAEPGSDFKECANGCPTMIVVPAGKFTMGSPETELDHGAYEELQREVTIAKPVALGKTNVTFAEWDICVATEACQRMDLAATIDRSSW